MNRFWQNFDIILHIKENGGDKTNDTVISSPKTSVQTEDVTDEAPEGLRI